MNPNTTVTEETVKVGVVLSTNSENVSKREDAHGVDFKSTKDESTKLFIFDQVVMAENIEHLHSGLLQPLTESTLSGYNVALLICGVCTDMIQTLTDHSIVRKVLKSLFNCIASPEQIFLSVSFLQFYPDGSALDLLCSSKKSLQLLTHPILGSLVKGLSELSVTSADEAYAVYETCRDAMKANPGPISSRCSSLFSVAVERMLSPEQGESDVCCSRLQLFHLAGGASRTDLRGVNPLLKVLDQINDASTVTNNILHFLLKEALTGNTRAFTIYNINPKGLLDNETPSALELAEKTRSLMTKSSAGRWNPNAAERTIREQIFELQNKILSQEDSEVIVSNISTLAELTQNLQIIKNQQWEKRRQESEKLRVQVKSCSTARSEQLPGGHPNGHLELTETMKRIQDQLRQEVEEHIKEGGGSLEEIQERVKRMNKLKDMLREETLKMERTVEKTASFQQSQLEYNKAEQRRRQLKEDHARLIQEEVATMERDLAQEQLPVENPQRELQVLSRERQVLVLQIEALRAEAQQVERDLEDQHNRHQVELQSLKEESLQVFRVYRQVNEEQKKVSESRYRGLLLDAVQDAIYLSAQNQQLQAENRQLQKALGEIKDAFSIRRDLYPDVTQQQ